MVTAVVVDVDEIVVTGAPVNFDITIQEDGSAKNLTGLTVQATIRGADDWTLVLDAALEDHAVSLTDAANGAVRLALTAAQADLLHTPPDPQLTFLNLLQFTVVEDGYKPQLLRFKARDGTF